MLPSSTFRLPNIETNELCELLLGIGLRLVRRIGELLIDGGRDLGRLHPDC